ncbi:MAG: sodium:alanine symporter family protein [Gammaproteobacteria bacterium]|jgi:alanine or glycine:cation symporter, AGCS family|nr:sodium:alanine symporter family protein [Gammaproteobacteria bacterium]MBT5223384.1 sodium:alanine symporter family protein [Gammaproteobacteria bacterium]MBT6576166.1 sodium:alanine symporter family protein [Gammaproteobacteria bacterium]MBT7436982.1 sodium:alanine symporter family protein [Gammaproteobacteria bacterium]
MKQLEHILTEISSHIWGPVTLALLLGIGVYLTIGLRFFTLRKVFSAMCILWQGRRSDNAGDITPFQALMTALSATIGTGNIAGVATAIALGGPGAIFWMWLTALFGMATKYAEAVLAVKYREVDDQGLHVGGPMYYIQNGLSKKWRWLAYAFAFFGAFAAFGIGNMVQANSVADAIHAQFQIPTSYTAIVLTLFSAVVIFGGIRRIGEVAASLVPVMAISYIICALWVIISHYQEIPQALGLIVQSAFTETAAVGGFTGAAVWAAIRFGVARGVFSNEAGLGSAPIAHAAAKTNDPILQGMIAMLGTFIDTILVCTMTALVIILSGVWSSGENGAALSTLAFEVGLPGVGSYVVVLGLVVFAFTTILGWSYYGERCAEYLFGTRVIWPYRLLWLIAIPIGAMSKLTLVWLVADILNGLMAIPNLIALGLLSPVIFRMTRHYLRDE